MFRALYTPAYEDLAAKLQRRTVHGMKWIGGATRQRVRRLARQQARLDMQQYRKRTPHAAAN
jgi:hypothetical protein